ncbi:glycosyltransferase family 1 protein [Danxiaibacter flavus]|uniref:Glycosyltransferase family 1 protein n=1 Tax=Danxiaibacter flavus TaxID=3049108 RepID=A0ABV3ZJT0_9BACT|nr:glycosyltransferase family 1 protein [Chitinophagaceae bacterium DXS]
MKKRLAFISDHASPLALLGGVDAGGQNVYVAELAKQLTSLDYEVDIYTRKDNISQQEIVEWQPGIRVIHIKAGPEAYVEKEQLLPHMNEFTHNMVSFIKRNDEDYMLIHANFFMSGWVASALKKELNIPYVITFHALGLVRKMHQKEMDKFPENRADIEKFICRDADHIIAECPQDKDDLVTLYKADPKKISIIPCGFNTSEFHPINKLHARKFLHLEPSEKIILQLGRMVPRKGIDNVIRALGLLSNSIYSVKLVIVGGEGEDVVFTNSPERKRLQQIADEAGISANVVFAGRKNRDVLKYYYAAADIFITTPWYEPFGITPLEAMACGTPVIGSAVGGIKHTVKDGHTGFLVPPNDAKALAEKMELLLNDSLLLESMSYNAIKRVNKRFTWTQVAQMADSAYATICAPQWLPVSEKDEKTDLLETIKQHIRLLRDAILQSMMDIQPKKEIKLSDE